MKCVISLFNRLEESPNVKTKSSTKRIQSSYTLLQSRKLLGFGYLSIYTASHIQILSQNKLSPQHWIIHHHISWSIFKEMVGKKKILKWFQVQRQCVCVFNITYTKFKTIFMFFLFIMCSTLTYMQWLSTIRRTNAFKHIKAKRIPFNPGTKKVPICSFVFFA